MWKIRLEDEMGAGLREWLGKLTLCVNIFKVRELVNRGSNELWKRW